jgi:hypothetical protein
MLDILSYLPAKRKQTPSGWISFNAVCCHHNGDSPDRRQRGGLKTSEEGWSYHCFNCGYTASFILGRTLTYKAKKLLTWMGVPDSEIERMNLESLRHKSINGLIEDRRDPTLVRGFSFEEKEIPPFCEVITPAHTDHWQYLRDRKAPLDYPFMMQSEAIRPGIIIPFTYNDAIVGWTTRFMDTRTPKYINQSPANYVFGTDLQQDNWNHALVVEGIFDALSINGMAVMHNTVSDEQARLIRSLGRSVTVVPDQDEAGLELVDRAVELGWAVSMPVWPKGVKDVNDSVIKYGRLATLITIFAARETSKIKIEIRKKQLAKRL